MIFLVTFFKELYIYRQMLFSLVRKDLKSRYKGSILGFFWTFLRPLLQLAVYATVFSFLLRDTEEFFALFLFVALLPWIMFVRSVSTSTSCIVANSNMVKKIYFPRHILPIAIVTANMINYLYSFIVLIPTLLIFGIKLSVIAVTVIIPIIILYLLCIGLSLMVSSLFVRFRDLEPIVDIALMACFYITPIVYSLKIVPDDLVKYLRLNPLVAIIGCIRSALFYNEMFHYRDFLYSLLFAIGLFIFGMFLFSKQQKTFAEEL